ncbi:uncharacterized protein BX664DRAFT_332927 [Halteromyces radiatus]|uniref:uncharacterized protein n=1 Tax=Halteromyces radiatus TaxID=101107 RepID=UPI002220EAD6|nr:uncharacterized protein BX664DRAFT_332927 [Halteromyces radiatus]KAI8089401.1 hypothetical protein BX664DRAFT_332927 [Halteromyces radiatus]
MLTNMTSLTEFCIQLPKVEAHAHINGSLSPQTLRELVARKVDMNPELAAFTIPDSLDRIDDFFALFKFIYQLTDDESSVAHATKRVMEEFAADGVRYLELRTTPRANLAKGMTKQSYVKTVVSTIQRDCPGTMVTKLILSIDRRNTLEEAQETVDLAIQFAKETNMVVGVDLCGDVMKGSFLALKPAFERAQQHHFNITLHFNEVKENIPEAPDLLSIHPDRLGHATLLDDLSRNTIYQRNIPVEICMTSNVFSKTVATYERHHVKELMDEKHPFILCTDDKGVFASELSNEYVLASKTFGLNRERLFEASFKAIDSIFADQETKDELKAIWLTWKKDHQYLFVE